MNAQRKEELIAELRADREEANRRDSRGQRSSEAMDRHNRRVRYFAEQPRLETFYHPHVETCFVQLTDAEAESLVVKY